MTEGCAKAGVKLLEPIMDVEVVTPGDFVGGVIGDINSRRGQIRSQEMRGNATVVRANVPLANMFGYVSQLRSMSQGAPCTPCSSPTTPRCRATWPTRSRRSTPERQ